MSAILPCPTCENLPAECTCDLSVPKVINVYPMRIIVTGGDLRDVSLSLGFGGVTVDQVRGMISTLMAWSDRVNRDHGRPAFDPLLHLFDARESGMGYGSIAKMFNLRWEDRRRRFKESEDDRFRQGMERPTLFEMTRLGISLDRAREAWIGDRPFDSNYPLTKSRVVGKLTRKSS